MSGLIRKNDVSGIARRAKPEAREQKTMVLQVVYFLNLAEKIFLEKKA